MAAEEGKLGWMACWQHWQSGGRRHASLDVVQVVGGSVRRLSSVYMKALDTFSVEPYNQWLVSRKCIVLLDITGSVYPSMVFLESRPIIGLPVTMGGLVNIFTIPKLQSQTTTIHLRLVGYVVRYGSSIMILILYNVGLWNTCYILGYTAEEWWSFTSQPCQ